MTHPLTAVLDDLADLVGHVGPDRAALATPCPEYDVAALRQHVLGWLQVFSTALADPDGEQRPDPAAHPAPDDPETAAAEVRAVAAKVAAALAGGVEDRAVRLLGDPQPGAVVVGMMTAEVTVHGWDLARATGLPWQPPEEACRAVLAALGGMLQPQYRGPGMPFGAEVAVADDATPLERVLAFSGRDPRWAPAPGRPSTTTGPR